MLEYAKSMPDFFFFIVMIRSAFYIQLQIKNTRFPLKLFSRDQIRGRSGGHPWRGWTGLEQIQRVAMGDRQGGATQPLSSKYGFGVGKFFGLYSSGNLLNLNAFPPAPH